MGSEHHSQPSAPTHLPALPSLGACLLPSTSCLILSLETFRYLSQLHTWKKREGEGGEMLAVLPRHLLPAWSTQPRTAHPQQRLGSPQSHASWQGITGTRPVPPKGGGRTAPDTNFGVHKPQEPRLQRHFIFMVFSQASLPGCSATARPRQTSPPSPTQCQKTSENEVALKHQADTQSCDFKIGSLLSHMSYGRWPWA